MKLKVLSLIQRIVFRQWRKAMDEGKVVELCKLPFLNLVDQDLCFHQVDISSWLGLEQHTIQNKKLISSEIYYWKGSYHIHLVFLD